MVNIEKYLKIPYKDKGRDWNGVDCWGLATVFYKEEFGITLPPYLEVNETWRDTDKISKAIDEGRTKWRKVDTPKFGDLIVFNIVGRPVHIGIILNNKLMLHALDQVGVSIEPYNSLKWSSRIAGFYSYDK